MPQRLRAATTKFAIALFVAIPIIVGGFAIYYFTAPPQPASNPSTVASSTPASIQALAYQDNNGQPQGAWAKYLGYIPAGYHLAPHRQNAPTFPCPSGMSASQCSQFEQSCGNGVCDPNESCSTCPLDCGTTGNVTCDPYTGRAGEPASVCQAVFAQNQGAVVG